MKSDLDAAATQFSEFASKNTAIDIPAQGKAMVEAAAVLQGQLIAAQAQVSGLERIYTQNNIRVQAMNAHIAELRGQLQKLGGGNTPDEIKNENTLYPSIRKLPLLGVTYADLFRRTKIEETVFELLTQQYELAKVQEAKEIPSVKILDAAVVPTVKTSPHRVLLTLLGALLITLITACWILFRKHWDEIDPNDPGRILGEEMAHSVMDTARRLAPAPAAVRNAVARARAGRDFGSSSDPSPGKSDAAGLPHPSS